MSCAHTKVQKLDSSPEKTEFKNSYIFRMLRWTSFLMIPLTFLYDEYIHRPKLSEQKKPFEYIVPPPSSGIGTKNPNHIANRENKRSLKALWVSKFRYP